MTLRQWMLTLMLCAVTLVAGLLQSSAAVAVGAKPYNVVSDSYYRLDVAAGTMSVKVTATFHNTSGSPLPSVPLWLMPGARDLSITAGGTALATKVVGASDSIDLASATLPQPLGLGANVDIVATYTVPPQSTSAVHLAAGAEEAVFVSQGAGSFVVIDMPMKAENFVDPGCVVAATQPADVKAAGNQRWVCGEILGSVFGRTPQVEAYCAAMDDRCRQRSIDLPISAFAQSITDLASRGLLEADVQMQSRLLHVTFRYFKSDEAWAQQAFAAAKVALPKLEAVFGSPFPYPTMTLRESHYIELGGAAGISYFSGGDVLLAPDSGYPIPQVVVHELSHQWAGGNMAARWEAEGLAEYGMRTVAPAMGFSPIDYPWQASGYTDNLALWGTSPVTSGAYWYGKAGSFWFAFQKAIGGQANMTKVLAQTSPSTSHVPFDARWFMDEGEAVSGANLDSLFTSWVFNPATSGPLLKTRRAAHNLVAQLDTRAAAMGLSGTPRDIQENLDAWAFDGVAAQVAEANRVLDSYATVLAAAKGAGLSTSDAVPKSWGGATTAGTASLIGQQQSAIQSVVATAIQLKAEPDGSSARRLFAQALQRYQGGDFAGASQLASQSAAVAANEVIASQMIDAARSKQHNFSPGLLGRVGLLFADPDAQLADAQRSYASGDPTQALSEAKSALDAWDGASSAGLERLAIAAAIMAALSLAVWWLLHRREERASPPPATRSRGDSGDLLESRRPNWRDWENTRTPDGPP